MAEFEALTAKYEKLNWRMISKPGGATVKPDDFYQLYGCDGAARMRALTCWTSWEASRSKQGLMHL